MKHLKTEYLLVIVLLLFNSCRKELDIDVPNRERSIVVNSILTPSNQINVNITRSTHILDDVIYDTIKKVQVIITENDNIIEELSNFGSGIHLSNSIFPTVGNKYSIKVTAPDFKAVAAEFTMPQPVQMASFLFKSSVVQEDEYFTNDYFEIEFQDPPGEKNFYAFDLLQRSGYIESYTDTLTGEIIWDPYIYEPPDYIGKFRENLSPNIIYNESPASFSTDDIITEEYGGGISGFGILFTDELIDGKKYKLRFYLTSYNYEYSDPYYYSPYDSLFGNLKSNLKAQLTSISDGLYSYLKSYYHQNSTKNEFGEFWFENLLERREAVPVYTNIENGYGIFGGYSFSVDSMETDKQYENYYYYYK